MKQKRKTWRECAMTLFDIGALVGLVFIGTETFNFLWEAGKPIMAAFTGMMSVFFGLSVVLRMLERWLCELTAWEERLRTKIASAR